VLPITITVIAAVLLAVGLFGVPIQGFIATHESEIYDIAIALVM
jgi:hypothetical protein